MTPSHPHSAFAKPPPDPQTQTLAACAIALNCLATLRHALDAFQSHAAQTQQPRLQHLACAATAVLDDCASQLQNLCPDSVPCPPNGRFPTLTWRPQ
ncbi:hypothetical protein [Chromobacterium haemolyticum]|uniref:hypothetical protein n=1 Tax=Chromobacterium haemolyticum TaxID=394935 RepID=UPI00113155E1|nr:hypothetical protein [Chromobacterium haemolyticum]